MPWLVIKTPVADSGLSTVGLLVLLSLNNSKDQGSSLFTFGGVPVSPLPVAGANFTDGVEVFSDSTLS